MSSAGDLDHLCFNVKIEGTKQLVGAPVMQNQDVLPNSSTSMKSYLGMVDFGTIKVEWNILLKSKCMD